MESNKELMNDLAGESTKNKELTTEVTSVVDQEQKTGQKIELPKPEELLAKAYGSFISSMVQLEKVFIKLSSKQKTRTLIAILDLPTEGSIVKLKTKEEQYCYLLGQRIQSDRFIIIQDAINKQIKAKQEELLLKQTEEAKSDEKTEEIKKETI
jgi:hypothetical protein